MTEDKARFLLGELLRLHSDVDRFQKLMSALAMCPEIRSSSVEQSSQAAQISHRKLQALKAQLVKLLAGSNADLGCGSSAEFDPAATTVRM